MINAAKAPRGGKAIPPMDAGSYPSRVVVIADLGLQPQMFNNEQKDPKREISITYEHLDEFLKDDAGDDIVNKPRWNTERFALNNLENKKAKSTQRYTALDPQGVHGGDYKPLLTTPCMVTLAQNPGRGANAGKVYNQVMSVSAMRPKEAEKAAALVNEALYFDLDEPDIAVFYKLPQFIQDKIVANLEYKGSVLEGLIKANPKPAKEEAKKVEKAGPPKQKAKVAVKDEPVDDEVPY